jgi:hypothetical protein
VLSKAWAISTSVLPAAACKTIWARSTKRAARVRLREALQVVLLFCR